MRFTMRHDRRQYMLYVRLLILVATFAALLLYSARTFRAQDSGTPEAPNTPIVEPRVYNSIETIVTDLPSAKSGQTYRLFIALPQSYNTTERDYPVMYVLDGNALFTLVRDTAELLRIPNQIPEVIVVGIGYPEPTYMDTLSLREYDMTFHLSETGGGVQFLDVLQSEIIPIIEQNYRADASDRGLLGWSLGGDFVVQTMFRQPDLFRRLAAISPPFVGYTMGIKAQEETYSAQNTGLDVNLFLASESPVAVQSFNETLQERAYTGFRLTTRFYENQSHFTVVPHAIPDALDALYP